MVQTKWGDTMQDYTRINGALRPVPPEPTELEIRARLEKEQVLQAHNLEVLMREWDDLVDWARGLHRKYVPTKELLDKLESLRPF